MHHKLLRDCTSSDLDFKKFKRCWFPWQWRETISSSPEQDETLLEFPELWFVNKTPITGTKAKSVSFCTVVNLSLKRWTINPKLSNSAQLLISYIVPQWIRGLRKAELQDPEEGEEIISSKSRHYCVQHQPFGGAPGVIAELKALTPGLTKRCELPTAAPRAARSGTPRKAGGSSLLRSSRSRGSGGRNAARSAGTAGSAWLAWAAAKQNPNQTHARNSALVQRPGC